MFVHYVKVRDRSGGYGEVAERPRRRGKVGEQRRRRTRTTKSADQVRADLLSGAARLFATRGFSEVSIADIARTAGVATGTFYAHFPSKDDVVAQLRCAMLDELLQRATVAPAPHRDQDWWSTARGVIQSTVRFWFEDRERSRVVLRGGFTDDAVSIQAAIAAAFAAGIRAGQDLGAVNAGIDPELAAGFLMHGAFGLIYHAIVNGRTDDPANLIDGITTLARHLLIPPTGNRHDQLEEP